MNIYDYCLTEAALLSRNGAERRPNPIPKTKYAYTYFNSLILLVYVYISNELLSCLSDLPSRFTVSCRDADGGDELRGEKGGGAFRRHGTARCALDGTKRKTRKREYRDRASRRYRNSALASTAVNAAGSPRSRCARKIYSAVKAPSRVPSTRPPITSRQQQQQQPQSMSCRKEFSRSTLIS